MCLFEMNKRRTAADWGCGIILLICRNRGESFIIAGNIPEEKVLSRRPSQIVNIDLGTLFRRGSTTKRTGRRTYFIS